MNVHQKSMNLSWLASFLIICFSLCRALERPEELLIADSYSALLDDTNKVLIDVRGGDLTTPPYSYMQSIIVPVNSRVAVIGSLQGDAKSLQINLEKLRSLGIMLGNNLTENSYLVFLGNYVDLGYHGLEVMQIIMHLKMNNPKNLFLLRGHCEFESQSLEKKGSQDFLLKDELVAKYPQKWQEVATKIIKLWENLPQALFVGTKVEIPQEVTAQSQENSQPQEQPQIKEQSEPKDNPGRKDKTRGKHKVKKQRKQEEEDESDSEESEEEVSSEDEEETTEEPTTEEIEAVEPEPVKVSTRATFILFCSSSLEPNLLDSMNELLNKTTGTSIGTIVSHAFSDQDFQENKLRPELNAVYVLDSPTLERNGFMWGDAMPQKSPITKGLVPGALKFDVAPYLSNLIGRSKDNCVWGVQAIMCSNQNDDGGVLKLGATKFEKMKPEETVSIASGDVFAFLSSPEGFQIREDDAFGVIKLDPTGYTLTSYVNKTAKPQGCSRLPVDLTLSKIITQRVLARYMPEEKDFSKIKQEPFRQKAIEKIESLKNEIPCWKEIIKELNSPEPQVIHKEQVAKKIENKKPVAKQSIVAKKTNVTHKKSTKVVQ